MNIISFSLFGTSKRYWQNIPYWMASNSLLLNYDLYFYVHKPLEDFVGFKLMKNVAENHPNIHIELMDEESINTRGAIWRMQPLWFPNSEYLFCRDLDAIMTSDEVRAMLKFKETDLIIHGIRAHPAHDIPLLAGLCGFNCHAMRSNMQNETYNTYLNRITDPSYGWGFEQAVLTRFFFTEGKEYLSHHTLDTPLRGATPLYNGSVTFTPDVYNRVDISNCDKDILNFGDTLVNFEGQAYCLLSEQISWILNNKNSSIIETINKFISKDSETKEYYNL